MGHQRTRKMRTEEEEEKATDVVMVERSTTEDQESMLTMKISRTDQALLLVPQLRPMLPRSSTKVNMMRRSKVHVDTMESMESTESMENARDARLSRSPWLSLWELTS